jgi:hypothetical protein
LTSSQAAGLILKRLQQLDPDLAVTLAVVQQQAVGGIELAMQMHAAKGRVGGVLQLGAGHRLGGPALGVAGSSAVFSAPRPVARTPATPATAATAPPPGRDARAEALHGVARKSVIAIAILNCIACPPESSHAQSSHRPDADCHGCQPVQRPVFLVKDDSSSNRLVIALSVRVALAATTVGLIAWGFFSGQLVSHAPW